MRPRRFPAPFLALFSALSAVALGALATRAAAEREFAAPPGEEAPAPGRLAPRCYEVALALPGEIGALRAAVRLTPEPAGPEMPEAGWYRAARGRGIPGVGEHTYWRPAGPDSLDIAAYGYPYSVRARVPAADTAAVGRARVTSDAGAVVVGTAWATARRCRGAVWPA